MIAEELLITQAYVCLQTLNRNMYLTAAGEATEGMVPGGLHSLELLSLSCIKSEALDSDGLRLSIAEEASRCCP